ncbi:pilus assembly FimT family protein [Fibrobacter sp. UBA4309]|uniref:pilus assembly FimT family protein n=1 Tax=Fibrobacter sp. UBA4309 TaxID=1946537 RepID=UPI0025C3012B|nr:prepilin-type N-terminal cleavage/methylation domain-containing protein [Fibrobacter sp. UBA4309]
MLNSCSDKRGVTLIEVLAVVTIMGILAGIGVTNMRAAIMNSRIKDAGINVTAFMQRAANEATRLNEKLCLTASGKSMKLFKGECTDSEKLDEKIDEMNLESANQFVTTSNNVNCPELPAGKKSPVANMTLTPKIGKSPIPAGCFLVRYGSSDRFASSIKLATKFGAYYKLSYDAGSSWIEP